MMERNRNKISIDMLTKIMGANNSPCLRFVVQYGSIYTFFTCHKNNFNLVSPNVLLRMLRKGKSVCVFSNKHLFILGQSRLPLSFNTGRDTLHDPHLIFGGNVSYKTNSTRDCTVVTRVNV